MRCVCCAVTPSLWYTHFGKVSFHCQRPPSKAPQCVAKHVVGCQYCLFLLPIIKRPKLLRVPKGGMILTTYQTALAHAPLRCRDQNYPVRSMPQCYVGASEGTGPFRTLGEKGVLRKGSAVSILGIICGALLPISLPLPCLYDLCCGYDCLRKVDPLQTPMI